MQVSNAIDSSPLTKRYWVFAYSVAGATVFEYFDLFIVGYVIVLIAPQWGLTFGQTSAILIASGIGAILGALIAGWAAARFGRKPVLCASLLICSSATCLMAATPVGAWYVLAGLRFVVGAAVPSLHLAAITLLVEMTPARKRTTLSSLMSVAMVPFGGFLAALAGANSASLGWQGLCLLGGIALLFVPVMIRTVPESPQWLMSKQRKSEAEKVLGALTGRSVQLSLNVSDGRKEQFSSALASDPARTLLIALTWFGISTVTYGLVLWGPTLIRLVLDTTPVQAATLFIAVSLAGLSGRILASLLAGRKGRQFTGVLFAGAATIALVAAAFFHGSVVGNIGVFLPMFIVAYLFADGGWANAGPMPSELFPTSLRTQAAAFAQVVNAIGKIVGPMILGLVAGSGDLVTPKATIDALQPAFIIMAVFAGVVACSFLALKRETHGRSLPELEATSTQEEKRGVA